MLYNIQSWVKYCQCCKTAKGPYTDPEPPQGSIVASNPMNLLLIDFMKLSPSKNGKENVLVMADAFSKFCVAVITPNQKAKMVAKALIDEWFYTNGIPACIHSDQGKSFDNHLIEQLCKLYCIQQSTTTLYNPQGISPCECSNCTLQNLLKMPKDQKPNWPEHLSNLVFAYNVTLHSTAGYQLYQLMFGCKASMPCDNWLALTQYNSSESISKNSWVQEQYKLVQAANKYALKSIQQSTQKSAQRQKCKLLDIPEGNLVLLHNHPEGHNKIQDKYKETEFVMVLRHVEPNVHDIKPINGKGLVHTVNKHQLQDLERTQEDKDYKDPYSSHQGLQDPSYNPSLSRDKSPLKTSHPYATHSKGEPPTLSLSTTAGMESGGLRKAQTQSVTFCSKCVGVV